MARSLQLSGLIHSKFSNETAFAKALGWSRQRVWKLTTGKKIPTIADVKAVAEALDTEFMVVANIFLQMK